MVRRGGQKGCLANVAMVSDDIISMDLQPQSRISHLGTGQLWIGGFHERGMIDGDVAVELV